MNAKNNTKKATSINDADANQILNKGKKRNLLEIEKYVEIASSESVNKRMKFDENKEASNMKMDEKEKTLEHKNVMTDIVKTRTHCRRKLTAENLKTILRFVLANNSVLSMVQNTMKLQKENESQREKEDQTETTIPKVKEYVKPPGHFLTPKKPEDVSKKLLEEEYSEESASDEDYQPNEEEELSDEDAASSVKADDLNSSKIDESDILPDVKSPNQLSEDEDALVIVLPETNVCHAKEVEKIAQRTRSKFPLNDTPLETIESSFQPPDITIDMYDTHCDDANWKEFLCEFTQPLNPSSGISTVADDTEDEKDPEYKVQEEEEEEDEDEEIDFDEICGENPLEVTGDEVNALMTEILEYAQQDKNLLEEDFSFLEELSVTFSAKEKNSNGSEKEENNVSGTEKNETNSETKSNSNDLEASISAKDFNEKENNSNLEEQEVTESHFENVPHAVEKDPSSPVRVENVRKEWMIPDEKRQLDEQMRMYVQLLTQSYLLSYGFPSLHFLNASSRIFLNEIKIFASRETVNKQRSTFYAHNLDLAVDIVNRFENQVVSEKDKKGKMNKGIPDNIKQILASSKAFIYPELLPRCGFYTFYTASKAMFSIAEDNLIALGLDQFSCMENPIQSIQQYLLPTKSEYQIKCRIKNSKQKKENTISYFCKHKKLPDVNRVIRIFDPNNIKAPEDYPLSYLPAWMDSYCKMSSKIKESKNKESQRKQVSLQQGNKLKLILPRIQIVPTIFQEYNPPNPQGVPQPLICKVYSVSEKKMSQVLPRRIKRQRKRLAKNQVNKSTQCPEIPSESACTSQSIKLEVHSQGISDEESVESENNSDSDKSSECSLNSDSLVLKRNYSLRKRPMVTRSMSTNHETCQTESSERESLDSTSDTFHLSSVKEEPLPNESSDTEDLEKNSTSNVYHPETGELRTLNNSTHKKQNQLQAEHSTLTEPSLRIVTSQGDESSDSDEGNVICNELLAPIQRFYCGISEDAVLPPESSSVQKHLPSDFSSIRDIITSEEKREKILNTGEAKVLTTSKKSNKNKKNWSMEEDQLIISNCQKYGINKRAFRTSAGEIGSVTPIKVRQRFIYLLKLLSEKLKNGK